MHAAGIQTGADLKTWSLQDLQERFGKAGGWYYAIARGQDDRAGQSQSGAQILGLGDDLRRGPDRPGRIEAGVLAMADDVWAWCEKTGARGRTVTVKIKWADFQQSTRSQSLARPVDSRATLHEASLGLIRSVFPPPKGIRLVGVTLSNFITDEAVPALAFEGG